MKMNKKDLFALMGKLDDHYIAASAYIAEGGEDMAYERPARRRAAAFSKAAGSWPSSAPWCPSAWWGLWCGQDGRSPLWCRPPERKKIAL